MQTLPIHLLPKDVERYLRSDPLRFMPHQISAKTAYDNLLRPANPWIKAAAEHLRDAIIAEVAQTTRALPLLKLAEALQARHLGKIPWSPLDPSGVFAKEAWEREAREAAVAAGVPIPENSTLLPRSIYEYVARTQTPLVDSREPLFKQLEALYQTARDRSGDDPELLDELVDPEELERWRKRALTSEDLRDTIQQETKLIQEFMPRAPAIAKRLQAFIAPGGIQAENIVADLLEDINRHTELARLGWQTAGQLIGEGAPYRSIIHAANTAHRWSSAFALDVATRLLKAAGHPRSLERLTQVLGVQLPAAEAPTLAPAPEPEPEAPQPPAPSKGLGGYLESVPIRGENGPLRVNDTIHFGKDDKRFVVVALRGPVERSDGKQVPVLIATALSGADKGSFFRNDVSEGMYGSIVTKMRFPSPIFYGKQAKERYDHYLKWLAAFGDPANAVPFRSAPEKPVEPDAPHPPSDTETSEEADVSITHTTQDGSIIDWKGGKGNPHFGQLRDIARRAGFVWAPQARQWRRTNSIGLIETRAPVAWMVHQLHALGLKVFLGLEEGETEAAIARRKQYLTARSGYMAEASVKWRGRAQAFLAESQRRAEESVRKAEIPGYFPTPPEAAKEAVKAAQIRAGSVTLDPSAGHGALANALRQAGAEEVDTIEINAMLRRLLMQQGFPVVAEDAFDIEFRPGSFYDRIVMNPPFEEAAWIDHIRHVWQWLKPGGRLVAIVPQGVVYRSDKKHAVFREWFEGLHGRMVDIEAQGFGRAASIKTQMLIIDKPMSEPATAGDPATIDGINEVRFHASQDVEDLSESNLDLTGLTGKQAERAKAKAERAKAKAREAGEYADVLQRRSESRAVAAARTEAVDVSKGGRSAQYKPTYYGPSQTSDEFLSEMRDRMGRIKKPTGAIKVERGFFGAHDISYTIWFSTGIQRLNRWSGREEPVQIKLSIVIYVPGGRYPDVPPEGAGFLVQTPYSYSTYKSNTLGSGMQERRDPDGLFKLIVSELNRVVEGEKTKLQEGGSE